MSPHLRSVISRLYRPPPAPSPRQVFALPRADAEQLPPLETLAIVSITPPGQPDASLPGIAAPLILRLSFADVDFLNIDISARAKTRLHERFTAQHAAAIVEFVAALPPEIRSIVVHCVGGYSRSCAVAKALNQLYGYAVEHERLEAANPSILRVMMEQGAMVPNRRTFVQALAQIPNVGDDSDFERA